MADRQTDVGSWSDVAGFHVNSPGASILSLAYGGLQVSENLECRAKHIEQTHGIPLTSRVVMQAAVLAQRLLAVIEGFLQA